METSINDVLKKINNINMSDEKSITKWCDGICSFYETNDRHSYAEITKFITLDQGIEYSYVAVKILENLKDQAENEKIKPNLIKLIDHIKLEQIRYSYYVEIINQRVENEYLTMLNDQLAGTAMIMADTESRAREQEEILKSQIMESQKKMYEDIKNTQDSLTIIKEEVGKARRKVESAQKESVTILGIFASIVLAFTGGMTFSSSVLENIERSSAYRVLFVCWVLGFILFNTLTAMMAYIHRVVYSGVVSRTKGAWRKVGFLLGNHVIWISVNVILMILFVLLLTRWNHSYEKARDDESFKVQIETYRRDLEELRHPEEEAEEKEE